MIIIEHESTVIYRPGFHRADAVELQNFIFDFTDGIRLHKIDSYIVIEVALHFL